MDQAFLEQSQQYSYFLFCNILKYKQLTIRYIYIYIEIYLNYSAYLFRKV